MQLDEDTPVREEIAREIAERESIKAVIAGEVVPLGQGYVVSGRLVSASGEVLTAQQASASDASALVSAVQELSAKLRERIGESLRTIRRDLPLELVTTGSLDALRLYTQANQAEIAGDDDRAVSLLEEAIATDTTFAMAYRKLGVILRNNREQRGRTVEALSKAYELRGRLTPLERGYAVAQYHIDVTGEREEALAAYRTILDKFPDDDRALNNSGVLYTQLGDFERAIEFYRKGMASDSTWAPRFSNIAFVEQILGRFDSAAATLEAMDARFPGNPRVLQALASLASGKKDYDAAEHHLEQLGATQSGNLFWRASVNEGLGWLAQLRGQYREGSRYIADALTALEQRDVPSESMRLTIASERNRMLATQDPEEPRAALERAVNDDALAALPVVDRPYAALITFYALAAAPDRARALLADMERSGQPGFGRSYERSRERATAWVNFAEGDIQNGLAAMRRGVDGSGFQPATAVRMAYAHDMAGNADSSRIYWEQYLGMSWGALSLDSWALSIAYRRLGELYEASGENPKATEYYNGFVELWKDADPELRPQVEDVKNRIARLVGEGR